jgi:hypothetical protein
VTVATEYLTSKIYILVQYPPAASCEIDKVAGHGQLTSYSVEMAQKGPEGSSPKATVWPAEWAFRKGKFGTAKVFRVADRESLYFRSSENKAVLKFAHCSGRGSLPVNSAIIGHT